MKYLGREWGGRAVERDAVGNVTAVAVDVPGGRNKKAGAYYLTPEATLAMSTAPESDYLRDLEAEYRAHGVDFPIFPGGIARLRAGQVAPVGVQTSLNRRTPLVWFTDLEAKAGVRHEAKRAFHGFRRRAVDVLVKLGVTPAQIQAAGGWSSIQIPMDLYRAGISDHDRREAAALLGKHRMKAPDGPSRQGAVARPHHRRFLPRNRPRSRTGRQSEKPHRRGSR
jgi:hypothetical protein